jgi:catechol 2,3-dioxygenase-like lactoylglutathione lyase family enzyme
VNLADARSVTTIPVVDLERAKRFYGETLGLRLLWEAGPSARFEAGHGAQISIFRRGPTRADHTVAHFEVQGLEAFVRELAGRGVEFLDYDDGPLKTAGHIAQMGPARGAWFRDTEGNILGLREG